MKPNDSFRTVIAGTQLFVSFSSVRYCFSVAFPSFDLFIFYDFIYRAYCEQLLAEMPEKSYLNTS